MEFRQLEYFYTVSRLKNFTKAAEEMHISQPSITTSIQKLENELETKLLIRTKKKVELTEEGEIFLKSTEKILHQISDSLIELQDFKKQEQGIINVAVPPMIGAYLFPKIFTQFHLAYPNIQLNAFEEGSLKACELLENEELDVGLIILPEQADCLSCITILSQSIVVALSPDHPLSAKSSLTLTELEKEPLIFLKKDSFHRQLLLKEFAQHHLKPKIAFESNQIETIKAFIQNNVGISLLMKLVVENCPGITWRPLTNPLPIHIGLAWKKGKYLSRASKAFIKFVSGNLLYK